MTRFQKVDTLRARTSGITFENASAVAVGSVASTGAWTFGTSSANHVTTPGHTTFGAFSCGNTGTADASKRFIFNVNSYQSSWTGTPARDSASTTLGGAAYQILARTADSSTCHQWFANSTADTNTTNSTLIGSISQAGQWTLGKTTGLTGQHSIQGDGTGNYTLLIKATNAAPASAQSNGLLIQAGLVAADTPFAIANQTGATGFGSCNGTGTWALGPTTANNTPHLIYGGQYQKQVTGKSESAMILFEEKDTTPALDMTAGAACKLYMKADKLVIVYNDAGTYRYKYLDLTGTGITWVHTTTAP